MSEPVFSTTRSEAGDDQCATLVLEPSLSTDAAPGLLAALLEHRGAPLVLDASAVEQVGGLAAEVLVSAISTWADDDQSLTIDGPSDAFHEGLTALGLGDIFAQEVGAL